MTATIPTTTPSSTVAERVAEIIAALPPTTPPATQSVCKSLLIDVAGLCIAARDADFMAVLAAFRFDNSFARELPGLYVAQRPATVREPRLLFLNDSLAEELGLDLTSLDSAAKAAVFAGNTLPEGAEPLAQAYAGHQFGGFSPQLGDGRALLLGEVIDRQGRRRDIAFKGSGRTPFARGGDGKAAVGPMPCRSRPCDDRAAVAERSQREYVR